MLHIAGDGISVKTGEEDMSSADKHESLARIGKFLEKAAQVHFMELVSCCFEDLYGSGGELVFC